MSKVTDAIAKRESAKAKPVKPKTAKVKVEKPA